MYTRAKSDFMKQLQDQVKNIYSDMHIYMKVMYRQRAESMYVHALLVST